jgi:hypothetical protein
VQPGRLTRACQLEPFCSPDAVLTGRVAGALYRAGYSRFSHLLAGGRLIRMDLCDANSWSDIQSSIANAKSFSVQLVVGYFQFFELIAQECVWNKAQIKAVLNSQRLPWPSEMLPDYENDCILHVRRGDFAQMGFPLLYSDYYCNALSILQNLGFSGRLFVMTDHPDQLAELELPMKAHLVDSDNPMQAMALFGRFRYQVIANSTFSLWSSLLGREDSVVIFPNKWGFSESELMRICTDRGWRQNDAT